jgi:hypothetical protein
MSALDCQQGHASVPLTALLNPVPPYIQSMSLAQISAQ